MTDDTPKYELTDEIMTTPNGNVIHRIRALKNFHCVEKGTLGGFVESESNLSQTGLCWVWNDAKVYQNAHVSDNAYIFDIS